MFFIYNPCFVSKMWWGRDVYIIDCTMIITLIIWVFIKGRDSKKIDWGRICYCWRKAFPGETISNKKCFSFYATVWRLLITFRAAVNATATTSCRKSLGYNDKCLDNANFVWWWKRFHHCKIKSTASTMGSRKSLLC